MSADEFSLIQRYFSNIGSVSSSRIVGVGDDAAVVSTAPGTQLVTCMDTLIESVHFPRDSQPADIAHKALAVNLSDLAAMGAKADWFQLSLSLPTVDESWLAEFARALNDLSVRFGVELIGGDTCRGALSITVQASGLVPANEFVLRSTASSGDLIVVSGTLGDAALGLAHLQDSVDIEKALAGRCVNRLNRPEPRLELASFLRQFASAAIDISDGLVGDLGHITKQSKVGALIEQDLLPVNHWIRETGTYHYALFGGDDYEICLTLPEEKQPEISRWNAEHPDCPLTMIGRITESGFILKTPNGEQNMAGSGGFRHFE